LRIANGRKAVISCQKRKLSAVSLQLAIPYLTNRPISYSTASPNELNEPYEPLLPINHSTGFSHVTLHTSLFTVFRLWTLDFGLLLYLLITIIYHSSSLLSIFFFIIVITSDSKRGPRSSLFLSRKETFSSFASLSPTMSI